MKTIYLAFNLLFALLVKQTFAKQDSTSFPSILPQDTLISLEVDNWVELKSNMSDGPWGQVSSFPVWKKLSKWIDAELKHETSKNKNFEEAYDRLVEPVINSLDGEMIFGISDLENLMVSEKVDGTGNSSSRRAQKMPFFAAIFKSSLSKGKFAEMITFIKEISKVKNNSRIKVIEEKVGKVKIFWIFHKKNEVLEKLDPKSTGFCMSLHKGQLYFLMGDAERVESVFEKQNRFNDSLAGNDTYVDCFEDIGKGQARIFINFNEGIGLFEKMKDHAKIEIPQNPFGVNVDSLIQGLGLDGLNYLGLQLNFEDESFEISSSLGMSQRNGLLALLAPVGGDLVNHKFIADNVFSVSNARQDLFEIWPRLETMLKDISPGLHLLVTSQIQAFEDQADVAVRDDLLGSLGSEFVSLSYLNRNNQREVSNTVPSSTIYAIRLKDADLFDRTMRAVMDSVSQGNELFEDREYRGTTIRSMRGLESAGLAISYAIMNDWLLLSMGKERFMNQLINKMEENEDSLWDAPFMNDALEDLPSGIRQTDYVDFREMFSFFQIMTEAIDDDEIKFSSEDFGEFPYFMFGWSKDTDNGIVSKLKMYPFNR